MAGRAENSELREGHSLARDPAPRAGLAPVSMVEAFAGLEENSSLLHWVEKKIRNRR